MFKKPCKAWFLYDRNDRCDPCQHMETHSAIVATVIAEIEIFLSLRSLRSTVATIAKIAECMFPYTCKHRSDRCDRCAAIVAIIWKPGLRNTFVIRYNLMLLWHGSCYLRWTIKPVLNFHLAAAWTVIYQTQVCSHKNDGNIIMPVSGNNKTIEFMFLGINMFWARLRLALVRAIRPGLKWALRRAQNIFMPKNINSVTIIITLKGIEKLKTEKMTTKQSEEYFFQQRCEKTSTNTVMASRIWLAAYIVRLFDSHFSLVYFSGLKYSLAHQILHFSP